MSYQYLFRINFGICLCWGYLYFFFIGRYNQRECQIPVVIFQTKPYYVLPWGFPMFQQQEIICNSCKPMRRNNGHRSFWSFLMWWILIVVSHIRSFQKVFVPWVDFIYWMQISFWFLEANGWFSHFLLNHYRYRCGKLR